MRRKHIYMLVLLVCCLFIGAIQSYAADDRLGTVVDGSLLTDGTEAEATVTPRARGVFLSRGTGSISVVGGRKISAAGSTACYYSVDSLSVRLYVQRLEGNSWVTVNTVPAVRESNSYYVSTSKSYSVAGGYYYRVAGAHSATDDGAYEACASSTNGIWID